MAGTLLSRSSSMQSLSPEDAPLRLDADEYAAATGARNLEILNAIAKRENVVDKYVRDTSRTPFTSNQVRHLLAMQALHRRRQNSDVVAVSSRDDGRRRAMTLRDRESVTRGRGSSLNVAHPKHELSLSCTLRLDEFMIRIAAISDRGDCDYTGRFDLAREHQIVDQIEDFLLWGLLPLENEITLTFINGLYGTLHVIHALKSNAAIVRDRRANLPTDIPWDGDGLIEAARNLMRGTGCGGLLERTKILDLIEKVPFRFIALGHKHHHSPIAQTLMSNFPPLKESKTDTLFKTMASSSTNHSSPTSQPRPVRNETGFDSMKSFEALREDLDRSNSPEPPNREPTLLRTSEEIFTRAPGTKAGKEPYLLSRAVPSPNSHPSSSKSATEMVAQTPTTARKDGHRHRHDEENAPTPSAQLPTGMPAEHAAKMGLDPHFGQITKSRTQTTNLPYTVVESHPAGTITENYQILATMLAEERKEAEYARYKCGRAERLAEEATSNAKKHASEVHFVYLELEAANNEIARLKGLAEMWEERCALWERNFRSVCQNGGEEFFDFLG